VLLSEVRGRVREGIDKSKRKEQRHATASTKTKTTNAMKERESTRVRHVLRTGEY